MKKFSAMDVRIPFWHTIPSARIDWHDPGVVRTRPTAVNFENMTLYTN